MNDEFERNGRKVNVKENVIVMERDAMGAEHQVVVGEDKLEQVKEFRC